MLSYLNSGDAIAFITESENTAKKDIVSKIRAAKSTWSDIEADVFTYRGRTLVLARKLPPALHRVNEGCIRLHRI